MVNDEGGMAAATQTTRPGESLTLPHRFTELMREGTMAYNAGQRRQAHQVWRRAATLNPQNEDVWVALLDVLDTDADRRVCLENILAINPNNARAQRMLRRFTNAAHRTNHRVQPLRPLHIALPTERPLWRVIVWWIEAGLLGVGLAILFSILLYGGL